MKGWESAIRNDGVTPLTWFEYLRMRKIPRTPDWDSPELAELLSEFELYKTGVRVKMRLLGTKPPTIEDRMNQKWKAL